MLHLIIKRFIPVDSPSVCDLPMVCIWLRLEEETIRQSPVLAQHSKRGASERVEIILVRTRAEDVTWRTEDPTPRAG